MSDQDQEHPSPSLPSSPPISRWLFSDSRALSTNTTSSQDVFASDTRRTKPKVATRPSSQLVDQPQLEQQSVSEPERNPIRGTGGRVEVDNNIKGQAKSVISGQKKVLPRSKSERVSHLGIDRCLKKDGAEQQEAHKLASRTYRQRRKETNVMNAAKALRYDTISDIALRQAESSSQEVKSDMKAIRKICELEFGANEEEA